MSFQGDVGGIGLAELLQSLTRGRREGVLRLTTPCGLVSTVGLSQGMVYFLPEEAEDPQIWKDRARQAWIHNQDYRTNLRLVNYSDEDVWVPLTAYDKGGAQVGEK